MINRKEFNKKYYQENRKTILLNASNYRNKNRVIINEKAKKYRKRLEVIERMKKYRQTAKVKNKSNIYNHSLKAKEALKKYNSSPKGKLNRRLYARKYRQEHYRSSPFNSIELQLAKSNVKKRDNNTCQWQGCGKNIYETRIDVHHIFSRKRHPEFELIESYMICYCLWHHWFWHLNKGDIHESNLLHSQLTNKEVV